MRLIDADILKEKCASYVSTSAAVTDMCVEI